VGKLYVERYFPPAKARMEQLVENLRTAYGQSIRSWTGCPRPPRPGPGEARQVQTPDRLPGQVEGLQRITIRPDDLVGNLQRARAFEYADNLARLGKPVDGTSGTCRPRR
jgi:predicted metalloendopeptidase